ncbi:MAG: ATP synthase F1 subunit gamma [Nitrospinae bacterium]|nr:ATP synthase F1 subunit gamma [Nitrospinota bacterium]
MASGRDIKRRITSVKNTRQITRAMKMVAAAKLRRAQDTVLGSRHYAHKIKDLMTRLMYDYAGAEKTPHPLFEKRVVKTALILVFSSDKGLCGAFNSNLFKAAMKFIQENHGVKFHVSSVGKKGRDFFRRRDVKLEKCWLDFSSTVNYEFSSGIAKEVMNMFAQGSVDKVYILYNRFRTVMVQDVILEPLLPLASEEVYEPSGNNLAKELLYEPSAEEVLPAIVDQYVKFQVHQGLLESWAGENGSRMVAMDSATRNAGDMMARLTLAYNRARQSAITKELIEIVSGADALKG